MTNLLCCFVIWFIFQILLQLKWNGLDDFRLGTRLQRYIFLYVHLINDLGFWIWTYYLSYLDRKVGSWHALFDCTNWFHFDLFWCGSKASKMGLEILWNIICFFATAIWYLLISCLTKTESLENKFSFAPKNERKYFCISALAYKKRSNQKLV